MPADIAQELPSVAELGGGIEPAYRLYSTYTDLVNVLVGAL